MSRKEAFPFWMLCLAVLVVLGLGFWVDTQTTGSVSNHKIIEIMTILLVGVITMNWTSVNQ